MKNVKGWLIRLDLRFLVPVALLLAAAPFAPEPHLLEKTRMLMEGTLSKPIDVFDLFMHGSGLVLVVLALSARQMSSSAPTDA